jgi:L-asparaginase
MSLPARALLVSLLLLGAAAVSPAATGTAASQGDRRVAVRLIATGGTISNRAGGRLTADELVALIPDLDRYARVETEQFTNLASSELSLDHWLKLARRINQVFTSDASLAGIVVTSGTDTLEEIAFFLHLAVRDDRPVVVVGSMRNPSTLGYEGAANLLAAIRVAADPASRGLGVLVVLNDEINSAREVTKTDARRLDTFEARGYGVLGVVDGDRVTYYRRPLRRHTANSEFDVGAVSKLPRVDVLIVYQDAPGDLIRAAVNNGARGIVMAAAGAGATSGTQDDGIRYALDRGVIVVVSTRTGGGRVAPARTSQGASQPARPEGALSSTVAAEDLSPIKARILLMLALTKTRDRAEIQRIFSDY